MPAQYEVHGRTQFSYTDVSSALPNLRLNTNVPKPTFIPANHAFVRIRAAALNFRDNMVIAHHPAYPDPHAQDLVPCADGAGEIESVGEGSSWKIGQRLLLSLGDWIDWEYNGDAEFPGFENVKSLGSKDANGTLREYDVVVCGFHSSI
jgi:NADPH:quinone reductase-like Zn-dependent oxidoreductase